MWGWRGGWRVHIMYQTVITITVIASNQEQREVVMRIIARMNTTGGDQHVINIITSAMWTMSSLSPLEHRPMSGVCSPK